MSVSDDDVRHVAMLARLGLDPDRIPTIAAELSGILAHMEVLSRVNTAVVGPITGVGAAGTPLRVDGGNQVPLARPRESFAPAMRDGFFLVPRLATHEDQSGESS
ncbi:MAG TPA: Asp-tRNA(Asn)/Glu-tRNA(Gln) amidotransferase subunit GatC [Gemmatimonadaceae bacterium]|jgi:aspartyl-tRNA(Asn)/glutamyl-tRNA(Gln) amidotransferase subunit C|nr:Asp-tRNA(Asn)/Glu-tRNA(Gln) amidotransferase subunit GatC [Gemmatimonadaceae bacterium]